MKYDKIWGYQNEAAPFKQGHHNSNFLTAYARLMKFSEYVIMKRQNSGHQNGGPSNGSFKIQTFQPFKQDTWNFQNR